MVQMTLDNFDLSQICRSGQCFRMSEKGNGTYSVIAGSRYLEVKQNDRECIFYCEEDEFDFWKNYFDLDGDYAACIGKISADDEYLKKAAEFGSGIRILRQDLWEMIVSFLISQQNNIVRIRRCIGNICERYGDEQKTPDGEVYYGFPKPESLAGLREDALMECNLGYRSKYVVRTAGRIANGETDLDAICEMTYEEAREELLKLYGVGEKVADCICLFSLHHLSAFPVDTHIKQVLGSHYINGFPKNAYSGFEGVMQQYMFYYDLCG